MPPTSDESYLLGQIVAKLDLLIERTNEDRKKVIVLDTRVRKLEQFRYLLMGASIAVGGASNWIAKILTS